MKIPSSISFKQFSTILLLTLLAGCTPSHDWREVRGTDASFSVLMPAKPMTLTRQIDLDGVNASMTMMAAEIDTVTYAVGSVDLADDNAAKLAVLAMKTAMVRNINGTILREKSAGSTTDLEASGAPTGGPVRLLIARFISKNQRAYQIIVTGPEKAIAREQVDTFMTSFKLP
ncbi:hypothetical protein [Actimicrobium sp. CCI2.3]|uniref:hypothetical protein n=1 Tax=Actimicrobium sp. CCI2.3 TaxID=3048616 RepID=UPI002AB427A3|nr:hypothetical protein [Actimicrobium sp. CCI2.3]MDY7576495.1 hypothetical protein [Actimicrobium sp. CCI2.3]MEB0021527.1 hypothetical protein [Actimicrobium sp. CCI2.3]